MEKNNSQRIYKMIMLVLIVIILTSMFTAFATYEYVSNQIVTQPSTSLDGLESTLASFRSELEKKYIGEINDDELIEGAIKGYVDALGDPYTTYYTKAEMEEIMEETSGNYVGIGVYMLQNINDNTITLLPMEGTPAEKAGVLAGDILTKVNKEECSGETIDEAAKKIKGEKGTKVTIEVKRNDEIKTFEITRDKVMISHINSEKLENNIGYIEILDFDGGTADEFKTKYEKLEKEGITKLIIDLRNNGGGIVSESLEIADMLLEKGKTVLITEDKNKNTEITKTSKEQTIKIPVVVLVNEYSASASEILAGALKDNQRVTLVGTKTYGKGVIQELHQLSDGSGLKITTNEYFTPNHNKINEVGIEPDIKVELSEEAKLEADLDNKDDAQLQKAIET